METSDRLFEFSNYNPNPKELDENNILTKRHNSKVEIRAICNIFKCGLCCRDNHP